MTEAMGGGVFTAIVDYARSTPALNHELLMAARPGLDFDAEALSVFSRVEQLPESHTGRVRAVARYLRGSTQPDLVHAHSSRAGVYVRLSAPRTVPIVYTPHCYAFERTDLSPPARSAIRAAEWMLARRSAVVAGCSQREVALARDLGRRGGAVYVPNLAPEVEPRPIEVPGEPLRLVGAGRLCAQKDPLFFADSVQSLRRAGVLVEAEWLGGGDPDLADEMERRDVPVSGWLSRDELLNRARAFDVYLHSAAWEGFPIGILEMAALGLPCVVRDIPSLAPYAFPYTVQAPADSLVALRSVGTDIHAVLQHHRQMLGEHTRERQAAALSTVYGAALRPG